MKYLTTPLLAVAILLGSQFAMADEWPPANSLALSKVIQALEAKGYSPITKVKIDDGSWEVKARNKAGEERKLKVNPTNGEITSDDSDD